MEKEQWGNVKKAQILCSKKNHIRCFHYHQHQNDVYIIYIHIPLRRLRYHLGLISTETKRNELA